MFLITEDNFCNKKVFDIKDLVIKIKSNRYVIYKDGKEVLSVKVAKSILTHEIRCLREYMSDRHFHIEYLNK